MIRINVNASSEYEVIIGKGILNNLGEEVKKITGNNKIMLVSDTKVSKLYLDKVLETLKSSGLFPNEFIIMQGEKHKNLITYEKVLNALASYEMTRQDVVIALGGGVVGDIVGFAASTYMRGIRVIQMPTTLLAAIDSSIGGKTGVNLKSGKNLVGAFYQPSLVFCDIEFFKTLPKKEWQNGLGEGIKYGVLCGGELINILQSGLNESNIEKFVELCVKAKQSIVELDEKESGNRRLLNLGHTFGHAVEKLSNYSIPHGAAVVKGLALEITSASHKGQLSEKSALKILDIINKYKFDISIPFSKEEIMEAVKMDKKMDNGYINYINIREIGSCKVQKFSLERLGEYIDEV
jgi:3-dehydroquinate synthase